MPGTATGTYTVNSDCTYTEQITDSYGSVGHHVGTISGVGVLQEVDYIYTDSWAVARGRLRRTWPVLCSLATLKGTYGIMEQGMVVSQFPGAPFPGVASGTVTYNGAGKFSAKGITNFNGVAMPMTATGTYVVNADCTYTDVSSPSGPVFHHAGTITGAGRLDYIYTDAWAVTIGTLNKVWQ